MTHHLEDMGEQLVYLRDAETVLSCLPIDEQQEFIALFDAAGWDAQKMKNAVSIACNNIPQARRVHPPISFYPY